MILIIEIFLFLNNLYKSLTYIKLSKNKINEKLILLIKILFEN